jgi:hypothetical protein
MEDAIHDNTSPITDETSAIDPVIAAGPEQPKARRGRQPGSKNKKARGTGKLAVTPEELAKQLQGIHVMLAMLVQAPIFQISDTESLMLSKAILNVGEQYNVDLLDGKTFAIIQLVAVGGMIYIPRIYTIQQLRKQAQQQAQSPENVDPHLSTPPNASNGGNKPAPGVFDLSAAQG